jgi:hypothetical protein
MPRAQPTGASGKASGRVDDVDGVGIGKQEKDAEGTKNLQVRGVEWVSRPLGRVRASARRAGQSRTGPFGMTGLICPVAYPVTA